MLDALDLVPDPGQLAAVVQNATVAVDTNVLLCAYRLPSNVSQEYLRVLDSLRGRYHVPHRVAFEYERRRGAVMREQDADVEAVVRDVQSLLKTAAKQLHEQHPYFSRGVASSYLQKMGRQLQTDVDQLKGGGPASSIQHAIQNDPLRAALAVTFAGQIGPSYEFDSVLIDACRIRREAGVPPGAQDSAKGEPDCFGDAMIWLELLELARALGRKRTELVFVTGDFKDDWWSFERAWRRGPRIELLQEMCGTGVPAFAMLSPRELFSAAGCTFSADLDDALRAVER